MITLKNVTLRRGAKVLLDSASVTLNPSEKVGLVGTQRRRQVLAVRAARRLPA
jgi:ABC-type uncharacterized transport system YnjBCD ATPase subunit